MLKKIIIFIAGLSGVFLLYSFCIEPYWIQEKHITVKNAKIPASFSGTKIIFVSDIHYGTIFDRERTALLVQRVNKLKPDIIILGGDYIIISNKKKRNTEGDEKLQACFKELAGLKAVYGVLGVLGNYYHYQNAGLAKKCMTEAGIELIENKGVWINKGKDRIRIGGVVDYGHEKQELNSLLNGTVAGDFVLLVSHDPDYIESLEPGTIDLMLSGHTHGGQFSFFGFWSPFVPSDYGQKYRTGVIKKDSTTLVVSNGVGLTKPALRFFTRPQIIIIELKKSDSHS